MRLRTTWFQAFHVQAGSTAVVILLACEGKNASYGAVVNKDPFRDYCHVQDPHAAKDPNEHNGVAAPDYGKVSERSSVVVCCAEEARFAAARNCLRLPLLLIHIDCSNCLLNPRRGSHVPNEMLSLRWAPLQMSTYAPLS